MTKHQACFTTKLQGQNLATFSHSAVMPIAYLQHTVNSNKTCVNNALKKLTQSITRLKKINRSTALVLIGCQSHLQNIYYVSSGTLYFALTHSLGLICAFQLKI